MKTNQSVARIALVVVVLSALAGAPAPADWLVTTDGAKIETRGPWQLKSGLVVFTNADGVLSSIRRSQCDLEASVAATEAAARPPAKPAEAGPAPRRAVLVLTDADVGHVRPEGAPEPTAEEEAEPGASSASVVVSEWEPTDGDDGVSIAGMLRNDGANVAGNIRLMAVFRDADGDPIETRQAALSTSTLAPGQKAEFRVAPFGLFSYAAVDFDIDHFEILIGRSGNEAAADGRR